MEEIGEIEENGAREVIGEIVGKREREENQAREEIGEREENE